MLLATTTFEPLRREAESASLDAMKQQYKYSISRSSKCKSWRRITPKVQKLHFAIVSTNISYPCNPLIANVLYSTTYIENWGSGVKRIMEACQKRDVAAPTWTVNGGFVVVTFMRPAKSGTQDDTQGGNLDKWIEN